MADNNDNLNRIKIIDNRTIAASGTFTSQPVNMLERKLVGNVTLQITLIGMGTGRFRFSQSNDFQNIENPGNFVFPSSASDIVTAFTNTSGAEGDGEDIINLPMFNSQAFKIVVTETGTANSITVNAWLSMQ